jgi:uncharacterized membrane-anchored protein
MGERKVAGRREGNEKKFESAFDAPEVRKF